MYKKIRQPRINGEVLRNLQSIKTESKRNQSNERTGKGPVSVPMRKHIIICPQGKEKVTRPLKKNRAEKHITSHTKNISLLNDRCLE